jgi:glycosyltransferase involved in cell wall biosynthesis
MLNPLESQQVDMCPLPASQQNMNGSTSKDGPLVICVIGHARSAHVAARASCFSKMGHEVHLVTEERSAGGIPGVAEHTPGLDASTGGNFARSMLAPVLKALGIAPRAFFQLVGLVQFLRRRRPDIVHVHFAHGKYAWFAGLIGARPLVVSVMGADILFDEQGTHTALSRWMTLELLRQADYITSKSHYLTAVLDRLGGFGEKAERIVWGVSLREFRRKDASRWRARFGLTEKHRVILSPRILQPLYRIHLLVEAMPLIVRDIPEAVILVTEYLPDATYQAQIMERVRSLGMESHVIFCGEVKQEDMPELYSLAEISAAVPSSDGLPQTLLEAMACGTPTLLSKLPRYEEIVQHEYSAYFVDATPEAIAAGVIRLLRDPDLLARIARNGLEVVAREADSEREIGRVLRRYRALVANVPARILDISRLRSGWRSYRRFRATMTT